MDLKPEEAFMKRSALISLFALSMMVLGLSVGAWASDTPVRANIPFAFYAGEQLLPAGEYEFQMAPALGRSSNLLVRAQHGKKMFFVPISIGDSGRNGHPDYLVTFARYGDDYFLSRVQNGVLEIQLSRSASHEKLALKASQQLPVATAK